MLYQQIAQNKRKTIFLILAFFFLLTAIGAAAGYLLVESYQFGIVLALILGSIYAFSMIFQSTNVVMGMNKAREITVDQAPDFFSYC